MRRALTLVELLLTIVIFGILLASLLMAGTAIFKAGADAKGIVPLSRVSAALDNIFARALRGETNVFTISDAGRRVDFRFFYEGEQTPRTVSLYLEGGTLWYDRDTTDTIDASSPERIADDIAALEFTDIPMEGVRRLGIEIELASGELIVTSVVARHMNRAMSIVD